LNRKTQFYIHLNIKTVKGPETFGRFHVGDNRERAYQIFDLLLGDRLVNENNVLFLDLMEIKNGLPVNLNMLSCTLDQLAKNCKTVTRELFKLSNLEAAADAD
jgi:hypothetical protein